MFFISFHIVQVADTHSALRELGDIVNIKFDGIVSGTIDVSEQHQLPLDSLQNFLVSVLVEYFSLSFLLTASFYHKIGKNYINLLL